MSTGTLVAHNPKFDAKLTSLAALRGLPEPTPMGPFHKPVAHAVLVDRILAEIDKRDYLPTRTQLALGAKGAALFGVIDLAPKQQNALVPTTQRGISFGFRSSTNQELAIKAVAGTRVFVCDNLALSGDMIAFQRKHTTGMDLGHVIASGFDRFTKQVGQLEVHIERLTATVIGDGQAKQLIFDVFNAAIVPVRLFDDVSRFYFKPADDQTDCQPRSLWGLHNAFTRAMKDLTPVRQFAATVALGKAFGMTAGQGNVVDADGVDRV